ncbi:MAG TPA: hypothetical protein VH814_25905 [Steroidobacteraceae bacterium]|jgi:hypothetical protein
MGTQTPNPPGQQPQTTPGKPGSRQSPDSNEGRDVPKTGRDAAEPLEDLDDIPTDDDEGGDADEDEDET